MPNIRELIELDHEYKNLRPFNKLDNETNVRVKVTEKEKKERGREKEGKIWVRNYNHRFARGWIMGIIQLSVNSRHSVARD